MAHGRVGLRIRVLGALEVDGVAARDLGSRKARLLLTALATARGQPVSVDALAELLWGDDQPANPSDQLSVLVSRLRRTLGRERIVRGDAGYAVDAEWIDVVELVDRIDEAAARLRAGNPGGALAAATAAVDLVRGPLPPDVEAPWFDAHRAAVERAVARARSLLAEAALAMGDAAGAAAAAEAALDHDPYDEASLRTLMRAHVAAGRPASALAAYARSRERLRDDLGVAPSPETEALHTAVVRGDQVGGVPPRSGGASVVGRDDELAVLADALARAAAGAAVAVSVEGEAGIGKTALVRAFAAAAAAGALAAGPAAAVLTGRCDALGRDLPLQPILDALDAPGLPVDLRPAAPPATTVPDVEAGRLLLFRSLFDVLDRMTASGAVVLIVEDVHLAGPSTLEWLQLALRRSRRLLVVTTRRPEGGDAPAGAERLRLGPLDLGAARALVGEERAAELLERSGGNPLFLVELSRSAPGGVPASIREAVEARVAQLGDDAREVLVSAAILGPRVDLDLLAAVLRRPAAALLPVLERAVRAAVLAEEGAALHFAHELVREALEATASGARRALAHREAASSLAARPAADPLAVAWHAERGGELGLAARALARAAQTAADRFDAHEADRLLTAALALADSAGTRIARGRIRMATWQLDEARHDAERAVALGGGVAALELAGWVAYYRRDHDGARRYADEGVARSSDPALRASCLALAGRTRHSRGDLAGAAERLEEGVAVAPPEVRGVALIWLAALRLHQGDPAAAADMAETGLVDPSSISHPFAPLHALFTRACALAMAGRPLDALADLDRLDATAESVGAPGRRFPAVAANVRGWVLRGLGRDAEADEWNQRSAELPDDPLHAEPRYVAHLDLVESRLAAGDFDGAAAILDRIAAVEHWEGTMAWRQRSRHRLARARVALEIGDADTAAALAGAVAAAAEAAGSRRYALFGRLTAARAAGARGAAGGAVDLDAVDRDLRELDQVAGLEAWWTTAAVAASLGVDRWWRDAERRAEALAARCGPYEDSVRRAAADRFRRLRR